MSDYTAIPRAIINMMKRSGEPLSEDQETLLTGSLFGYQHAIENQGLENVINNVTKAVSPNDLPMSKDQAIKAMRDGNKVTHRHFSPEEWMRETNGKYEFEDGCLCEKDDFWEDRVDSSWMEGWKIFY